MRNSTRVILSALYLSNFLFPLQSNADQMTPEETQELRKEALELIKDNKIAQSHEVLLIAEDRETKRVVSSIPLKEIGKKAVASPWESLQTFLNYGHKTASWAYNTAYNTGKYAYDNSPTMVQKGVDAAYNAGKYAYDTTLYTGEKTYKFSKDHPYIATAIAAGTICIVVAGSVFMLDGSGILEALSVSAAPAAPAVPTAAAIHTTAIANELHNRIAQITAIDVRTAAITAVNSFAQKYGFKLNHSLLDMIHSYDLQRAGALYLYDFLKKNMESPNYSNTVAGEIWDVWARFYISPSTH